MEPKRGELTEFGQAFEEGGGWRWGVLQVFVFISVHLIFIRIRKNFKNINICSTMSYFKMSLYRYACFHVKIGKYPHCICIVQSSSDTSSIGSSVACFDHQLSPLVRWPITYFMHRLAHQILHQLAHQLLRSPIVSVSQMAHHILHASIGSSDTSPIGSSVASITNCLR